MINTLKFRKFQSPKNVAIILKFIVSHFVVGCTVFICTVSYSNVSKNVARLPNRVDLDQNTPSMSPYDVNSLTEWILITLLLLSKSFGFSSVTSVYLVYPVCHSVYHISFGHIIVWYSDQTAPSGADQ